MTTRGFARLIVTGRRTEVSAIGRLGAAAAWSPGEELGRFAAYRPAGPTGEHDAEIDCWRARRVALERARAGRGG